MPEPSPFAISFTRQARKDLDKIDTSVVPRVTGAVAALADEPRPPG